MKTLTCGWCGKRFKRPHTKGTVPKYCKPAHRQAAFRSRSVVTMREQIHLLEKEIARLREIEKRYNREHRDDRYDPMG